MTDAEKRKRLWTPLEERMTDEQRRARFLAQLDYDNARSERAQDSEDRLARIIAWGAFVFLCLCALAA